MSPVIEPNLKPPGAYWQNREAFHRSVIGIVLPGAFYAERDALEIAWRVESEVATDWSALQRMPTQTRSSSTSVGRAN
ncbi:MAG: hypothetical protein WBI14_08225 [Anaerolineaceae bacterium]